jgi:hypothetical protein
MRVEGPGAQPRAAAHRMRTAKIFGVPDLLIGGAVSPMKKVESEKSKIEKLSNLQNRKNEKSTDFVSRIRGLTFCRFAFSIRHSQVCRALHATSFRS